VSPRSYNGKVGLALLCPITSPVKGYPFEVALAPGGRTVGVILSDQLRSLDWRAREAVKFDSVSDTVMQDVLAKIAAIVGWKGSR
jgi:mRNA interferase MazF